MGSTPLLIDVGIETRLELPLYSVSLYFHTQLLDILGLRKWLCQRNLTSSYSYEPYLMDKWALFFVAEEHKRCHSILKTMLL